MTTLSSYNATEKWSKKGSKTERSPNSYFKKQRISKLYEKLCSVKEDIEEDVEEDVSETRKLKQKK